MKIKAKIIEQDNFKRMVVRIAHEILEKNKGTADLVIVGIKTGGAALAERIAKIIEDIEGAPVPVGKLDITFYRDDVGSISHQPVAARTEIPFDIDGKTLVLVDDVLYTGRSIRAALDELMDFGRPSVIQLAVLIDRGHRELPIRADFVGKNIPTSKKEKIQVQFSEKENEDSVIIYEE